MDEYIIDFDGVILDSQDRFNEAMQGITDLYEWMEYLSRIKWHEFLQECNELDESISSLRKLQQLQKLKAILTAIHSFEEGKEKLIYLRERGIYVPVVYSLPLQKKSEVIIPNKHLVLIDDKIRNCIDWRKAGGKALEFDPYCEEKCQDKIKSLKQIL